MNSSSLNVNLKDLDIIKAILKRFIPECAVWAFGSRIKGTARKFSDLDLVVIDKKPLPFQRYADLKDAFSNSTLPFKVDLVDWNHIDDNFKKIIENQYIVIQEDKS